MDKPHPELDPAALRSGTPDAEDCAAERAERAGAPDQLVGEDKAKKPAGLPYADKLGDFA